MKKRRAGGLRSLLCAALCMPVAVYAQRTTASVIYSLPAWIQAVGTIVSILLVSVILGWWCLSRKKHNERREKQQKLREMEQESAEMQSLLCSTRHELALFYMSSKEGIGTALKEIEAGGYLEHVVPVEHERYYIYPVCALGIGKIRDTRLGRCILSAYASQIRFTEVMKWNNQLLCQLDGINAPRGEHRSEAIDALWKKREADLGKQARLIFTAFDEMEVATRTVMEYINEDGTISPRSKHRMHSRYNFLNTPQSVHYK